MQIDDYHFSLVGNADTRLPARVAALSAAHEPGILLDVSRLVWRGWGGRMPTGIDRTCLAYVAHYRRRANAVLQWGETTWVLSRLASRRLFGALLRGERIGSKAGIAWVMSFILVPPPPISVRGRLYLNIGHTGLNRERHRRWVERSGVRPIYFLHDLIPITHPEHCREGEDVRHRARVTAMLDRGVGLIANSRDTLDRLAEFAAAEGHRPLPRTLAAPLGLEWPWLDAARAPVPRVDAGRGAPTFLVIGTIEGRKNHILLLRLWRELAETMGADCPRLIIVGQRGWRSAEALELLDGCPVLRAHVTEYTDCSDAGLVDLLRHARALLFPTHAEGYGLPLVEALALGTPVVASDLPVFREIAGDLPVYCDPNDLAAWRAAVLALLADGEGPRARLAAASYNAPQWDSHFALVDAWLAGFGK